MLDLPPAVSLVELSPGPLPQSSLSGFQLTVLHHCREPCFVRGSLH